MSKLFFSKMNINDEIYQVYDGTANINDLLNEIYTGINNREAIYDDKGGRYKLFDLDKLENNIIHGRLGYIKSGVHSSYNPDTDTAIDIEDKNKIEYVTFYFDVYNEMLAYTVLPIMRKERILTIFEGLIKQSTDIGVKFIIETDMRSLNNKLSKFEIIKKVVLDLVPPNGDKNEFASLFSVNADKVADAEATSIKQQYSTRSSEGLNKDSSLIKDAKDGIALGYANGTFLGADAHGEKLEVNTTSNTPYTKNIPDRENKSKSSIAEKARAGISALLFLKAEIRERNRDGESRE